MSILFVIGLLFLLSFLKFYAERKYETFIAPDLSTLPLKYRSNSKFKKCYDQYLGNVNNNQDDCKKFLECSRSVNIQDAELKKVMPELYDCASEPSTASGDFNIAPNMYNLYSQIAPQEVADAITGKIENFVNGFDPQNKPYGSIVEGFISSCMADPYRTCYKRYGADWSGYSQCVLSGQGLVE